MEVTDLWSSFAHFRGIFVTWYSVLKQACLKAIYHKDAWLLIVYDFRNPSRRGQTCPRNESLFRRQQIIWCTFCALCFAVSSGSVTVNADSSVQLLAEEAVPLDSLDIAVSPCYTVIWNARNNGKTHSRMAPFSTFHDPTHSWVVFFW